jgi:uncharacterized coiled-coil DUF342 family protein
MESCECINGNNKFQENQLPESAESLQSLNNSVTSESDLGDFLVKTAELVQNTCVMPEGDLGDFPTESEDIVQNTSGVSESGLGDFSAKSAEIVQSTIVTPESDLGDFQAESAEIAQKTSAMLERDLGDLPAERSDIVQVTSVTSESNLGDFPAESTDIVQNTSAASESGLGDSPAEIVKITFVTPESDLKDSKAASAVIVRNTSAGIERDLRDLPAESAEIVQNTGVTLESDLGDFLIEGADIVQNTSEDSEYGLGDFQAESAEIVQNTSAALERDLLTESAEIIQNDCVTSESDLRHLRAEGDETSQNPDVTSDTVLGDCPAESTDIVQSTSVISESNMGDFPAEDETVQNTDLTSESNLGDFPAESAEIVQDTSAMSESALGDILAESAAIVQSTSMTSESGLGDFSAESTGIIQNTYVSSKRDLGDFPADSAEVVQNSSVMSERDLGDFRAENDETNSALASEIDLGDFPAESVQNPSVMAESDPGDLPAESDETVQVTTVTSESDLRDIQAESGVVQNTSEISESDLRDLPAESAGIVLVDSTGISTATEQDEILSCKAGEGTQCNIGVEKINVVNNGNSLFCPPEDLKSEITVENDKVGPPAIYSSSETKIVFGSINAEESDAELTHSNGRISWGSADVDSESDIQKLAVREDKIKLKTADKPVCKETETECLQNDEVSDNVGLTDNSAGVHVACLSDISVRSVENVEVDEAASKDIICPETNGDHVEEISSPDAAMDTTGIIARPFRHLIKIPRLENDKLKEQIRIAKLRVEAKTQFRDMIRTQIQAKRATCQAVNDGLEAAKSEERAARRLVRLKRVEIDAAQSVINKVKNAISVEDIDNRIYNIEHMINHETLPLKEEKQYIREMKQLRHLKEQLSSNLGTVDELQQAMEQKDEIEQRLKMLKKELDSLKVMVSKAQLNCTAAGKKCDDEGLLLRELQANYRAADDIRQEEYANLFSLKKQAYEKIKPFWAYKEDMNACRDYASRGDLMQLHFTCVSQVEKVMELWNKNDEFRRDYVKCNMRSTVWRFGTLDARSLGPDDVSNTTTSYGNGNLNETAATVNDNDNHKSLLDSSRPADSASSPVQIPSLLPQVLEQKTEKTIVPTIEEVEGEKEEKTDESNNLTPTLTQEELGMKAAELKEQRRLEEKAKAHEALERKRRNAERAEMRAAMKAHKEAQQKDKEREKRQKKKERKKTAATAEDEGGSAESEKSCENGVTASATSVKSVVKKLASSSYFRNQSKLKTIPPPPAPIMKNRTNKKKWQAIFAWVALGFFIVFVFCFFAATFDKKNIIKA